jgi:hypothetical protein
MLGVSTVRRARTRAVVSAPFGNTTYELAATLLVSPEAVAEAVQLPAKITRQTPVTINTFLTKEEFVSLVEHMGNGNPVSHFLTVWRDDDGSARYAKARPHKRLVAHASWTWDTITGKSKRKTSMGLYPKNQDNQSTWGALDFDAHSGNDELAKNRSIRAFSLLLEYRDRYLLLSASGRGYHVFIFAREPRPVAEWTHLLKDTCESVGAPIQDGVCEIFPNERTEKQEVGHAIRVPGSFNPSTGEVELIIADTIRPLLDHLASREKPPKPPLSKVKPFYLRNLSENREADNSSYSTNGFCSATTGRLIEGIIVKYPIETKSTRNGVLLKLAGELFHKFGRQLSRRCKGTTVESSSGGKAIGPCSSGRASTSSKELNGPSSTWPSSPKKKYVSFHSTTWWVPEFAGPSPNQPSVRTFCASS